jgi:hypothetical protein
MSLTDQSFSRFYSDLSHTVFSSIYPLTTILAKDGICDLVIILSSTIALHDLPLLDLTVKTVPAAEALSTYRVVHRSNIVSAAHDLYYPCDNCRDGLTNIPVHSVAALSSGRLSFDCATSH